MIFRLVLALVPLARAGRHELGPEMCDILDQRPVFKALSQHK